MEIYIPILRQKGEMKLKLQKKKMRDQKLKQFDQYKFKEFYEKQLDDYTSSSIKYNKKLKSSYKRKRKVLPKIKIVD